MNMAHPEWDRAVNRLHGIEDKELVRLITSDYFRRWSKVSNIYPSCGVEDAMLFHRALDEHLGVHLGVMPSGNEYEEVMKAMEIMEGLK